MVESSLRLRLFIQQLTRKVSKLKFSFIFRVKSWDLKLVTLILATEVHFDNTPVPVENVLGDIGGGFKVNFNL